MIAPAISGRDAQTKLKIQLAVLVKSLEIRVFLKAKFINYNSKDLKPKVMKSKNSISVQLLSFTKPLKCNLYQKAEIL